MRVGFSKPITNKWAIAMFFMFFGLASLTGLIIVLYNQIGSPDMFYLNQTTDGVNYERVYAPGTTIFWFSFWGLGSLGFIAGGIAFLNNAIRENTGTFRPPRTVSQEHPRFAEGLVFFIIGLIAVAIPIALVFDNHIADADAETILGIAVCLLFAAPFLVLGTIWMKKRD